MARVWPSNQPDLPPNTIRDEDVQLPPIEVQERLINLYMTYIHPTFPVIHKTRFLSEYHARYWYQLELCRTEKGLTNHTIGDTASKERSNRLGGFLTTFQRRGLSPWNNISQGAY